MEMYQIRTFLAVVEHLNFTRAACELLVSQPSLTRAILRLEAELGGPLFRRERSRTHLTELGRMMLPHLQAAFAAAEGAKDQAKRLMMLESGSLILGVCSSVETGELASLVIEAARKVADIELCVEVAPTEAVERRLIAGEFDAAVLAPVEEANDRFDLHTIRTDDLTVAFAAGHRFEAESRLTLDALRGETLVVRFGCRHEDALARLMAEKGLSPRARFRSNDPRWVAEFVRGGLGCAIVPTALARAHNLCSRPFDEPRLRYRTVLATAAGRRHPTALTALIEQIRKRNDTAQRSALSDAAGALRSRGGRAAG